MNQQEKGNSTAQTEWIFRRLYSAQTLKDAESRVDWIYTEILELVVRRILTDELRRDDYPSTDALYDTADLFQDISLLIRSKISRRLLDLWEDRHSASATVISAPQRAITVPIKHLPAYAAAIARNACVDFLRRKYPGRHALDNALRALLQNHPVLALWQIPSGQDDSEWCCGRKEWQTEGKHPIFIEMTPSLRRALGGLSKPQVLVHVVNYMGAPVQFTQLLNVLADYWKVEAVYQRQLRESLPFRVPRPYAFGFQPEEMIHVMGALQNLWPLITQLIPSQAAILLLKIPPYKNGSYLDALVSYGIADWPEIAETMGVNIEAIHGVADALPLEDQEIADLLKISPENIPRIRQDARRRLARMQRRSERPSAS